ncbi:uncharacterized protein J8A68_003634 [[Candida] subhashii]|uniref:Zn(2)-C6 fungal-type domain-containing protein n=1 Tax=[Candida] subhashii TaxID=561895 RepID=A0A8J5Q8H9_9ASCO|nr:uncharacterized protein J8A68_003634 [[Candida] subhashii]KAG7662864.1 hypothetical protein J8A68_003634 [[Candida] subhashii]
MGNPNESATKKRRRVRQACDYCRTKKAKCDGLAPACTNCVINEEACQYTQASKRRGLPSGYTHDLEKKVVLFQAMLASLTVSDVSKNTEANLIHMLTEDKSTFLTSIKQLQSVWDSCGLSDLFDSFILENNTIIHDAKASTSKLTTSQSIQKSQSLSEHSSLPPSVAPPPGPPSGPPPQELLAQQQPETQPEIVQPNNGSVMAQQQSAPLLPVPQRHLPAMGSGHMQPLPLIERGPQQLKQQQPLSQSQSPPIGVQFPKVESSTFNQLLNTYSEHFINDPSFFLNYDIFQFISEEEGATPEEWIPVALQYHGLSSLISGFTIKAIQQYHSNRMLVDQKNPFRVGSIFNVSSFAIDAAISNRIKIPLEIFQFPSNLREMVDNYFQIYHPLIPMLDRISILRQVHHLQSIIGNNNVEKQTLANTDCNLIALVWAVLALGELATATTPETANVKYIQTAIYAKNAIMSLENSLTSTIETIQAQVLLGFFYYQLGQWDFSWVLISSGSRMAIDVRLMRHASSSAKEDENIKEEEKKYRATWDNINRERTWAVVYIVNTLLAARMGRSPVVRASDWPIPQINSDGWEEWDSWTCFHSGEIHLENGRFLSTFNEFIKVISILNLAITSNIDTSKENIHKEDEHNSAEVSEHVVVDYDDWKNSNSLTIGQFEEKLSDWSHGLPEYCRLQHFSNPSCLPPSISFLHLARALTWCILAVRLSSLKGGDEIKDRLIHSRDEKYTRAVKWIRGLINEKSLVNLKYFPFVDYALIMGFNFPNMMNFSTEEEKLRHCQDIKTCLVHASETSTPCKISYDLYRIMNNEEIDMKPRVNFFNPHHSRINGAPTTTTIPGTSNPANGNRDSPIISEYINSASQVSTAVQTPLDAQSKTILAGINALSPPSLPPTTNSMQSSQTLPPMSGGPSNEATPNSGLDLFMINRGYLNIQGGINSGVGNGGMAGHLTPPIPQAMYSSIYDHSPQHKGPGGVRRSFDGEGGQGGSSMKYEVKREL